MVIPSLYYKSQHKSQDLKITRESRYSFLKGTWGQNFNLGFMAYFVDFMDKGPCTKFCVILIRFHEVIKLQSFEFSVSDVVSAIVQNISPLVFFALFVSFMEKKPPIKFYSVFNHFLRSYQVKKFWMIKLYLDLSDVIHANKHTRYANCGLHINVWNFLFMRFCFMVKKDHFK